MSSTECDTEENITGNSNARNQVKNTVPQKRAADAIERDKAVRRKVPKLSNKEVTLKSSEALASVIKEMSQANNKRRNDDLLLWFEHERKERDKDRELQKMKLEIKERESQRKYELEMMRLRHQNTSATYGLSNQQSSTGYNSHSQDNMFEYNQGQPPVTFSDDRQFFNLS